MPDAPLRPARPPRPVRVLSAIGRGGPLTLAVLGLAAVGVSGEWSPAVSPEAADVRIWIVARAAGLVSFVLVTALTLLGLVLSHPTNRSQWKASKHLFPWHRNLALFTLWFIALHVAALALDPYAGVGLLGSFVPGLSGYRAPEVALGTLGLYALLLTGVTAQFTNLLPAGRWMSVHRVALVAFALSWLHGVGTGTDTGVVTWLYALSGGAVAILAATRYWSRVPRPARGASPAGPASASVVRRTGVVAALVAGSLVGSLAWANAVAPQSSPPSTAVDSLAQIAALEARVRDLGEALDSAPVPEETPQSTAEPRPEPTLELTLEPTPAPTDQPTQQPMPEVASTDPPPVMSALHDHDDEREREDEDEDEEGDDD